MVEAFLGGAVLQPGERRELHPVSLADGEGDRRRCSRRGRPSSGARRGARTTAPYQVGWCSWYHYFHDVTEADLRANLARAADWPFDVFQLDDGFQAAIGDWLDTNDKFPSALDALAAAIAAEGRTPGIWIAPFLAGADSAVAAAHPDWLATPPRQRHPARRHGQHGVGRRGAHARHDPARGARPPRVGRPRRSSRPASPT